MERARLHRQELLDEAERHRLATALGRPHRPLPRFLAMFFRSRPLVLAAADRAVLEVRIRYAGSADERALVHLAALDSAQIPQQPVVVAEVDGDLLAAMSLWDGQVVADPFRHTRALVELLTVRAAQIQSAAGALDELREAPSRRKRRAQPGSERA
jgi:hypothetical protein